MERTRENEMHSFLNAIEREFPGIIREVKAMEVDAGRPVAGVFGGERRGRKTIADQAGGEIVRKQNTND